MANDMGKLQIVVMLTLGLVSPVSIACTVPPGGFGDETPLDTLEGAEAIILAEWMCSDESCEFLVVETLLGEPEEVAGARAWYREAIRARNKNRVEEPDDFSAHRDERFWRGEIGRANHFPGMCTPSFSFIEGARYLLFPDRPASPWSAELILSDEDAWLEYVGEFVDGREPP